MAFDHKKNIVSQQFLAMAPKMVGIKYSSDIVICAFGCYATSWTLYNRLRDDFQLASLATVTWHAPERGKIGLISLTLLCLN